MQALGALGEETPVLQSSIHEGFTLMKCELLQETVFLYFSNSVIDVIKTIIRGSGIEELDDRD